MSDWYNGFMKLTSINPHDQSVVGELEVSSKKDILKAVERAKETFKIWKTFAVKNRAEYIKKYAQKLVVNKEKLATLITLEMGKPLKESISEIDDELNFVNYYAEMAPEYLSDEVVLVKDKENYRITYEPYGVCSCIAPWNFPLMMADSGILPALLSGNTVVFKPSEHCSLSQKMVFDLLNETGLPEGVINLIIGDGKVGKILVNSPIDLIWFTGSTKVGQEIFKKCGERFIKALLEMGGSSAGIVFADAEFSLTMDNLYSARFYNCGQVCSAIKRLFVEKSIYEKVVKSFVNKLKTVKIGNPMNNPDIGPLVSQKQLQILKEQVEDAVKKGARVETGGKQPPAKELEKGNYFEPTILTNVNFKMKVLKEETFGPVLPIIPFENEEEVIRMANNTVYGLSSEIYTTDVGKGERVAKQLESGTVAINTDNYFKPQSPFGGYKKSGMGKEYGKLGLQEFSQVKILAVSKP